MWVEHRDKFDLTKRSIQEVLNDPIWQKMFDSWNSIDKCFVECEQKCKRNVSLFDIATRIKIWDIKDATQS